nr:alpha-2-macroglobulin family protein [Methylomarinum sp. Ch1-1]MDP4522274.1 alpha-2-macroglobulin family protein [Methylomarinum sp. Ch1-1]
MQQTQALDDRGETQVSMELPDTDIIYGKLTVESSVRDERGKYIAAVTSADYLAVDRLVGLKSTQWLFNEDEPAVIDYLVVDAAGKPAAGTPVSLTIQREETVSARVKGAGNAYVSQFSSRWLDAGHCQGVSQQQSSSCEFIPDQPGNYKITATIKDSQGKPHTTVLTVWVAGKGRVVWRQPNDNSLQLIPEKTEYQVGDTARYLVKNPYPGADALVTLERYGVIKQWRQKLTASTPVIEFDIDEELLPGFYFSVVVMSPRVEKPLGDGKIDLGKPAFKIGYLKVPVRDPWKEIDVAIETDAEIYKPGAKVKAHLQAKPRNPDGNQPIELAVVVLDEAVLDLIAGGSRYFAPYRGFYRLEALDVKNYSLLTRLLGRQKFEKKGASSGGDGGGALSMRSLFKYVSYWNPSIKTDDAGNADIEFTLPDNLTGWRILALAVTPGDRMGLGQQSFKVNQPTEIRPVMPNQVSEGDRFMAGFSIMNRSDQKRSIQVVISAEGDLDKAFSLTKTLELDAYQRQTVYAETLASSIKLSRDLDQDEIRFNVTAVDERDGDALRHAIPILKRRALITAADYGSTRDDQVTAALAVPKQIHPDIGDISVELSPSVIGNIGGAFRYLRDYPYHCWEQQLSQAVMAAHFQRLHDYLPDELSWPESAGLPREILARAADFQAPNGGMTYYLPQNDYVSPYLSAYTALAFNWLRDAGHDIPAPVERQLHAYLQTLLRKDASPTFYSKGMAATVRAVALAALSAQGKVGLSDLRRYRPHVPYMSLFGKAHYLQAALAVQGGERLVAEVRDMIISHAQQSGGKLSFNEELDDSYTRILATPLRANCAILSALIQSKQPGDSPFKLVRTITQARGKRDHWENTQENLFCMQALTDYSRRYESEQPALEVSVAVENEPLGDVAFDDRRDRAKTLTLPLHEDMLGQARTVTITRQGRGRLYHSTRLSYAPREGISQPINAGIDLRREYSVERNGRWLLLDSRDPHADSVTNISRGELVRVDLYLSLPAARHFVVVEDPVPGGLEPVNRDLATASGVDAAKGERAMAGGAWWFQFDDWIGYNVSRWSFYHREIKHDTVRFYSDYLPAGRYHLSYTAQAIAVGEFSRQAAHAEEMYDPDVFGKSQTGRLRVEEK